jgi:hypothetical protein
MNKIQTNFFESIMMVLASQIAKEKKSCDDSQKAYSLWETTCD